MAKHEVRWRVALLAFAGMAGTASAQGAVRGQVSITERPGEISMDLGSSVVYLQPVSPIKPSASHSEARLLSVKATLGWRAPNSFCLMRSARR